MKPGSVVSVGSMRAFYTDGNEGPMYTFADGSRAREDVVPADPARTLVVIDPEDREQVEMLRDLWDGAHTKQQGHPPSWSSKGARGNALQAALREFVDPKPPKPDEPTGLGAVVETQPMIVNEDGDTANVLIRHADGLWWINGEGGWYWADVPAVKVLSEGVTA